MVNKNSMIHEIKERINSLSEKKYYFPTDTIVELDRYDEYVPSLLVCMYISNSGSLLINSETKEYGVETDKVSDFHRDFVEIFYNKMFNK